MSQTIRKSAVVPCSYADCLLPAHTHIHWYLKNGQMESRPAPIIPRVIPDAPPNKRRPPTNYA